MKTSLGLNFTRVHLAEEGNDNKLRKKVVKTKKEMDLMAFSVWFHQM